MRAATLAALLPLGAGGVALGQADPSGIDFVTVGDPGNRGYDRYDPEGFAIGRGSVSYEYKIGRFEVTTSQWLEFYNTFKARADFVPNTTLPPPRIWGAQADPTYTGPGTRYRLVSPDAGMRFTAGITWRVGAMFCNWLCNNKSSDLSAIRNGAYDTSTFGELRTGEYTDQVQHNPGARYWVPSLSEWMKASFWDPQANGGQGMWWESQYRSDTLPVYAPPPSLGGNGQSNTGFVLPGNAQFAIPLGAYQGVGAVSPWGLLDSAGGTSEWLEDRLIGGAAGYQTYRYLAGSSSAIGQPDWAYAYGADFPTAGTPWEGLRIASLPSPGTLVMICGALCGGIARSNRRRKACEGVSSP